MNITASLVLYRNAREVFEPAIRSVLDGHAGVILSIVDNSPEPLASALFAHPRVRYHHVGANIGFGAGHNLAFAAIADDSDVHFIVNPDVAFGPAVLERLANVFADTPAVTAVMPAIHDEANRLQHLCKALPSPFHLIVRRFIPVFFIRDAIDRTYEFRNLPATGLVDIPNLSGCFLAVRSATFRFVGGFDTRYFMYMEDIDLVRRLGDHGRTVYVPAVKIHHGHTRSSYRFNRLMIVHICSAISYFAKWGWFFDQTRQLRNTDARQRLTDRIQ